MLQKAIMFACEKHANQKRKGTDIPYIVHPIDVMKILLENKCSLVVATAGVLHDTIEDTKTSIEELAGKFGKDVTSLVLSLSEDKTLSWKERKTHAIETISASSLEVKQLACADKLSNLRDIFSSYKINGEEYFNSFNAPKSEIEWYYKNMILATMKELGNSEMLKELIHYYNLTFNQQKIKSR